MTKWIFVFLATVLSLVGFFVWQMAPQQINKTENIAPSARSSSTNPTGQSKEIRLASPFNQPEVVDDYAKLFTQQLLQGPSEALDTLAINFYNNRKFSVNEKAQFLLALAKTVPAGFAQDYLLDTVAALAPVPDISALLDAVSSSELNARAKSRLVPALTYTYDRSRPDTPQNRQIVNTLGVLVASPDLALAATASSDLARLEPIVGERYLQVAYARGAFSELDYAREILNILPGLPASTQSASLSSTLEGISKQKDIATQENLSSLVASFFTDKNWVSYLSVEAQSTVNTYLKRATAR
jgi:hypothetical protein